MAKYRLRINVTRTFEAEVDIDAGCRELARVAAEGINQDELYLTSTDKGQVEVVSVTEVQKVA